MKANISLDKSGSLVIMFTGISVHDLNRLFRIESDLLKEIGPQKIKRNLQTGIVSFTKNHSNKDTYETALKYLTTFLKQV